MVYAFIYGVFMAIGLIVPLGMQNIYLFNQGVNQRHFWQVLPSVITATICDGVLIIAAVLGVSAVVLELPWLRALILLIGVCFLLYMGWICWHSAPSSMQAGERPHSIKQQIVFSISVSWLNPHALLDTIGVIGTSSLQFLGKEKAVFVVACILTSCGWFLIITAVGRYLHQLDKTGAWLRRMNKLSAIILWTIAGYMVWLLIN